MYNVHIIVYALCVDSEKLFHKTCKFTSYISHLHVDMTYLVRACVLALGLGQFTKRTLGKRISLPHYYDLKSLEGY